MIFSYTYNNVWLEPLRQRCIRFCPVKCCPKSTKTTLTRTFSDAMLPGEPLGQHCIEFWPVQSCYSMLATIYLFFLDYYIYHILIRFGFYIRYTLSQHPKQHLLLATGTTEPTWTKSATNRGSEAAGITYWRHSGQLFFYFSLTSSATCHCEFYCVSISTKAAPTKTFGSGHPTDSPLKVKKVWIWWSGGRHFCYLVRHFESSPVHATWSTADEPRW